MAYKAAVELDLESKNVLIGHRLRLNGSNGINFSLPSMPGLWMSEVDLTFHLPDEEENVHHRCHYLANALMCVSPVPYENQGAYESVVPSVKKALVEIATFIRDDETFRLTDNYSWAITGHTPRGEFEICSADPDIFITVQLTPVFRSGDPVAFVFNLDEEG